MKTVVIDEFRGGLNNQKMIMAGCFLLARERGARVRLPSAIINFTPTIEGHKFEPLKLLSIFDEAVFHQAIPLNILANDSDPVTEVLSWRECFEVGGRALERRDNFARDIVAHLVANQELQAISNKILEWLRPMNPFALQLRIERDWQEYLIKKFGASNIIVGGQEITVDVDRILSKCKSTSDFSNKYNVWCCCDEDDLLVSKDDLKSQAALFGYNLLFKTDLPAEIQLPQERTRKSMVDFTVCMGLNYYVGLTRSTFSNQLFLMKEYGRCPEGAKHYIYNNIGDALLERR